MLSNTIFIVSSDYIDAYGQQMKNLSDPTDLSDATNKQYVDDISTIISSNISVLCSFVSAEEQTRISNDNFLSDHISSKIWIEDLLDPASGISRHSDLSIVRIGKDEFEGKIISGSVVVDGSTMYIVDSDYIDAYDRVLSNLSTSGVDGVSEAANTGYVKDFAASTVKSLSVDDIVLSSKSSDVLSAIVSIREKDGKIELKAKEIEV